MDKTARHPFAGRSEAGTVLLVVLAVLLAVTASSVSFIWFMNQQQTRAGARYRSAQATAAAEAGIHWAAAYLESQPERPRASSMHTEALRDDPGGAQFTVLTTPERDGGFVVTSSGTVAGTSRRLRARIYLASPAMLAALYGRGLVRFENPPTVTVILPYAAAPGEWPWVHTATGQGIWFASTTVSINNPTVFPDVGPGPADVPAGVGAGPAPLSTEPARFLFGQGAELLIDRDRQRVDEQQLRAIGVNIARVLRLRLPLPTPEIDRAFYQERARENTANADLNKAVGEFLGNKELAYKRDSQYSQREIEQIQEYAKTTERPLHLQGVIYVRGRISLLAGQRLEVQDGTLVTESTVHISENSSLQITHTLATRALPGLVVLDDGALLLTLGARLRVHGLVYVSKLFDVGTGAHVDIVGGVLCNDREISFRNGGTEVVIRYDPAVLGTPGLHVPDGAAAVSWVASWEELP